MLHLFFAVATSALISIIMRLSGSKIKHNIGMLAVSYITAAVLGALYMGLPDVSHPEIPKTTAMGIINGIFFLSGFVLMQANIPKNGVVLTSTYMRLGLTVCILLSILLFREVPTTLQIFGLLLAVFAIILHNGQKGQGFRPGLLVLLVTSGLCDTWDKVFSTYCDNALSDVFLFLTFLCAALLCVVLMLAKGQRIGLWELCFGVAIALPNYFNSRFLLKALQTLPGIIVYPTFSVATLLVITAVGVGAFKERLTRRQWLAMGLILIAIALLNIPTA